MRLPVNCYTNGLPVLHLGLLNSSIISSQRASASFIFPNLIRNSLRSIIKDVDFTGQNKFFWELGISNLDCYLAIACVIDYFPYTQQSKFPIPQNKFHIGVSAVPASFPAYPFPHPSSYSSCPSSASFAQIAS